MAVSSQVLLGCDTTKLCDVTTQNSNLASCQFVEILLNCMPEVRLNLLAA